MTKMMFGGLPSVPSDPVAGPVVVYASPDAVEPLGVFEQGQPIEVEVPAGSDGRIHVAVDTDR